MLGPLLWLSPTAGEVLRAVPQLLKGAVPCPASKFAAALRSEEAAAYGGCLSQASVREGLAKQLELEDFEISTATASKLIYALEAALRAQVDEVKQQAAELAPKMPGGDDIPKFRDLKDLVPQEKVEQMLNHDWFLWHSAGNAHSPELMPAPSREIMCERLTLAACAGTGPVAELILAVHVLENVEKYVAWEESLAGSKPREGSDEAVVVPFTAAVAHEVAVRRVLVRALPPRVATEVATAATGGGKESIHGVLKKMEAAAQADAIVPLYSPPAAPAGEGKRGKKEANSGAASGGAAATGAGPGTGGPLVAGSFQSLHRAAATHEYQWQLLAYRLRPGTTLGASAAGGTAAAAPVKVGSASSALASRPAAAPAAVRPAGFQSLWAPVGVAMPPGHTSYSWHHDDDTSSKKDDFSHLWKPLAPGACPPGHTPYSWERGLAGAAAGPGPVASSSTSAGTAAVASTAPPGGKGEPAPVQAKAKAKASTKAAPAPSGGGPAEGSDEDALCRLDIRCGRIIKCGRVPDADTLYLLKVAVGDDEPRQVVSSLVNHYKEEDLMDRPVVVYCNIKPGKMRGFESQAMLLAATKDKGTEQERCELLAPPAGAAEGARPTVGDLEVGSRSDKQSVKHVSKVWGQVQPLLSTSDTCEATFKGLPFSLPGGPVSVASLTGVGIY